MIHEKILCSAIWYKDLPMIRAEILNGFRPRNIDVGIVFSGYRHPHCLYQMVAVTGLRSCEAGEHEEGFLTNKNRFVDRKEAMQIAIAANQLIKRDGQNNHTLYSEDLYKLN